jgi:hypothetical protein
VNLFRKLCTFRHPRNLGSSPLPSSIRGGASSPSRTAKGVTRGEGRSEKRRPWKFEVLLSSGGQPMLAERASTENVSSQGVRVRTKRLWKRDTRVFVKSSRGDLWARARVVYCRTRRSTTHALGLEFYATAYRYNLTFRCINVEGMKPLPTFAATGLSARSKSRHGYIQLGVQDVGSLRLFRHANLAL